MNCGTASDLLLVTVAGEHGQAGVLGKARISLRQIAEDEGRAARGFDSAGMNAIGTEPGTK